MAETEIFPALIARLRAVGFTYRAIGNVAGCGGRQVQRWAVGEAEPRNEYRAAILGLDTVVTTLLAHLSEDDAMLWLMRPNERLSRHRSPYDALLTGGHGAVLSIARQHVLNVDGVTA